LLAGFLPITSFKELFLSKLSRVESLVERRRHCVAIPSPNLAELTAFPCDDGMV
jgi:hypothetical protein